MMVQLLSLVVFGWGCSERRAAIWGRPYIASIRSLYPVGAAVPSGPRTGDISPPGEVLSMDGKYPKIPGSADPDPGRTFGIRSEFVRRGHELGAAASSARCRSHLSNLRFPAFPLAPLVCLVFSASVASFLAPCRVRCPHRAAGVIGGGAPYTKNGWAGGYKKDHPKEVSQ